MILGAGVLSLVVGSIWYGPLFGKKWMEICGVSAMDEAKRKEMQKAAMPLYITQFLLSLLQFSILMNMINYGGWKMQSVWVASFIWLGFVMPTIAGSSMWNNDPSKVKWARFLIQAGYQLVMFIIYGFIMCTWG